MFVGGRRTTHYSHPPMATTHPPADRTQETCADCGVERVHAVTIERTTENADSSNAAFSREPYRVAECLTCGSTSRIRMNDA